MLRTLIRILFFLADGAAGLVMFASLLMAVFALFFASDMARMDHETVSIIEVSGMVASCLLLALAAYAIIRRRVLGVLPFVLLALFWLARDTPSGIVVLLLVGAFFVLPFALSACELLLARRVR